jgi:hypothetical protein
MSRKGYGWKRSEKHLGLHRVSPETSLISDLLKSSDEISFVDSYRGALEEFPTTKREAMNSSWPATRDEIIRRFPDETPTTEIGKGDYSNDLLLKIRKNYLERREEMFPSND